MKFSAIAMHHGARRYFQNLLMVIISGLPGINASVKRQIIMSINLTSFLLIVALVQASAAGFSQVKLSEKNVPLEEVLKSIEKQTGVNFFYDRKNIDAVKIDIKVSNATLKETLDKCLNGLHLTYEIKENAVYLYQKEPSFIEKVKAALAAIDVSGRILDEQNIPISGAIIQLKSGGKVATTDASGFFTLKNVDPKAIIVISFLGYEKKEVPAAVYIGNIKLTVATSKLDEVQVIAYGTTTQRYSVGSQAKVSAEEIASQPVMNPLSALEGRVAGLLVTSNSGAPGAAVKIQIRGQNTIGSTPSNRIVTDNPLFIIDGIPFAPQNASVNRVQGINDVNGVGTPGAGISPFNTIDPASIESIEVLKDADATSIYGARGANGVILITTKQGKVGKTKFSGNLYTGVSTFTRTMPLLNTDQYLEMRREAFANDGITPSKTVGTSFAPDLLIYDTNRYTNYLNELYGKNSSMQNANLSLSGGDIMNTFYVGMNYGRQNYMFPGDFAENRLNGSMKLHHNSLNRKFNIDFSTSYNYDHNNVPGSPSILSAFTLPPNFPALTNPDGSLKWDYQGVNFSTYINTGINPLAYLKRSDNINQNGFLSSMLVSYELLPGLKIKSLMGYNTLTASEFSTYPIEAQNPGSSTRTSIATKSTNNFYTWNFEPQISYDKQFGKEKINVLVGSTLQKTDNNYVGISGSGFTNDLLLGSISSATTITPSDGDTPYKYNAGFGRINYTHDNKYIVDFTGRFDGSSRFSPGKQWGKFGSMGAGWIFSQENFFKKALPFISFGKLRGSYGTTGNDNVGNYQYTSNWSVLASSYLYNGGIGYLPKNLENPDYSWSTTKKLEAAVELGLFNDRIVMSTAWFRNRSDNQLVQYQLPSQTGFNVVTQNFQAEIQNTGWEFVLSGSVVKSQLFNWKTSFNLTVPQNKLISFPGLATSSYANYFIIGQPVSTIRGYKYAGVNPTTGLYQFQTTSGTLSSTPSALNKDNQFILGNTDPKMYGGWRNTFSYKSVSLDLFFEFRKQRGVNYMSAITNAIGTQANVPVDALNNVWKNPGDQATYQRLTSQSTGAVETAFLDYHTSDAILTDASYIRLKTAGLSYSFSSKLIQKIGMNSCRIYANAQNLLLITHYKGSDPETQNYYGIPPVRTVSAGLNFGF